MGSELKRIRLRFWRAFPIKPVVWPLLVVIQTHAPSAQVATVQLLQGPRLTVRGHVVEVFSGTGVVGAEITFSGDQGLTHVQSDGDGGFIAKDVPTDNYEITVRANGYMRGAYGQMWPSGPGRRLYATANSSVEITIPVWKLATIEGVLTTSRNQPLVAAPVDLLPTGAISGTEQRRLSTRTDATGIFRFVNVIPGKYVVASILRVATKCSPALGIKGCTPDATSGGLPVGQTSAGWRLYQTTFFPGTPNLSEATVLAARSGERLSAGFAVEELPTRRVSGVVVEPVNGLVNGVVSLTRLENLGGSVTGDLRHGVASVDSAGRFVFPAVPAGRYEVRAISLPVMGETTGPIRMRNSDGQIVIGGVIGGVKAPTEAEPAREGAEQVAIDDTDLDGVTISLQRAASLRGTLDFQGSRALPTSEQLSRAFGTLEPLPGGTGAIPLVAQFDASGGFQVPSVISGRYVFTIKGLTDWTVHTTQVSGLAQSEILDISCCSPVQALVTLTDRIATVRGIISASLEAPEDVFVFVFPTDREFWNSPLRPLDRFVSVRARSNASFTISPLRPGNYYLIAVSKGIFGFDWRDNDVLDRLASRSARLEIKEGSELNVSLRPLQLE